MTNLSSAKNTEYEYEVSVPATVDTGSRVSGVTWYEVHTLRKADSKGTLVRAGVTAGDRGHALYVPGGRES